MSTFFKCTLLLMLNRMLDVLCIGQFYKITADTDFPTSMEKPLLTRDAFHCNRLNLCAAVALTTEATEEGNESNNGTVIMKKTHEPSAIYPSCTAAVLVSNEKDGHYNIQHDNMIHSVEVECKLINGAPYALIHHDSEATGSVRGYEEPGSFRRAIKCNSRWEDMIHFMDSSPACRQFTRFDCYLSLLYLRQQTAYSYLVDRSKISMAYIGGRPIIGMGCKCGITNQCAKDGTLCNCDKNDRVWRYDSGYITEKYRLPLTEVRIGETGHGNEELRYTIGPVECFNKN